MGIKFLCPQGHKLHVKSFLAGKRAICPKCGEKVTVPLEDPSDASDAGSFSDELAMTLEGERSGGDPQTATTVADPLLESPSAIWYVRPATGGQFGPASAEIMRGWLSDGRVGASSLVWRAGWEQWRGAADVFPQLREKLTAPAAVPTGSGAMSDLSDGITLQPSASIPLPVTPDGEASVLAVPIRKRRRRNEVSLMTSGVLLAISLILIIVLIVVFRAQWTPSEPDPAGPAATEQ